MSDLFRCYAYYITSTIMMTWLLSCHDYMIATRESFFLYLRIVLI